VLHIKGICRNCNININEVKTPNVMKLKSYTSTMSKFGH